MDRSHIKLIKKYLLESEITIKGHLYQKKQLPVAAAVTNVTPVAAKEGEKKNHSSRYLNQDSFQIQMVFSFPFLHANDLRSYLLNIIARSFLLSCT